MHDFSKVVAVLGAESRKLCSGQCYSIVDPSTGCGASSCDPCAVPNATATCSGGECAVGSCDVGRADCNGRVDDGCETETASSHDHCGRCDIACAANEVCSKGTCSSSCDSGLANCDGSCVDTTSSTDHCGACGKPCANVANGTASCKQSTCGFACTQGYIAESGACVPDNSRLALVGGGDGSYYLPVTWQWDDGATWTKSSLQGPSVREGHAMATLNGKVVLFGGANKTTRYSDTWEWDGATWTKRDVQGPSPRNNHAMATLHGKVVLLEGWDGGTPFLDLWTWDGASWTQPTVKIPPARYGHAMSAF